MTLALLPPPAPLATTYDPRKCGALCKVCPLKGRPVVPPTAAVGKLKLVIVGEAPGRLEEHKGATFLGPSGRLLDVELDRMRFSREEAHVSNAVLCRPNTEAEMRGALAACAPRLINELVKLDATVPILALGAKSAKTILGIRSIMLARGFIWEVPALSKKEAASLQRSIEKHSLSYDPKKRAKALTDAAKLLRGEIAGRTVLPSIHPNFVLRADTWRPVMGGDIERAIRLTRGEVTLKDKCKHVVVSNAAALEKAMRRLGETISVDVETDGPDPMKAKLLCVGASDGEKTVVAYPYRRNMAKVFTQAFKRRTVVGHNIYAYDSLVLNRYGIYGLNVDNVEDTLLAHHAFASHFPQRLDHVVSVFVDSGPWKIRAKRKNAEEKGLLPHHMEAAELASYNADDCRLTSLAWDAMQGDLESERRVYEHDKKLAIVCGDMQRVGFLMDDERRADVSKQLRYRAGGLVGEMRKLVGKSDFHPARLADVRRALFTRFRAPLFAVTPTGMPSTSSATLEALRAGDTRAAILSDLILRYRSATKTRATFLSVELGNDGRVHPSWRAFGTVSGRVACRAPNLMNLPRSTPDKDGNIDLVNRVRECYVAAPGYELVYFDLCFATGTGVDTPTGAVPIEKLKLGDLVYTYNKKTDRPAIGKVTQHINVGRKSVVKVTLDNGEVVRCTPDHKWLVRPWGKKPVMREAQLLQPGDRLVPLRKQIIQGREHIYATSAFKYSKTHIEVARAVHGPRPKNHDVHHKDENALNNAPGNLEYKHTRTHASEHGKVVARKCWGTPSIRRKLVRGLRAAVAANPNWQKGKNNSRFGDRRRRVVAVCLNCEKKIEEFASRPPRKFCSKKCYGIARRTGLNHKVVSVELDGAATVWSIAVSPDHNYALAAGVFVANCQAEMRFAANLSGDAAFIETCRGDVHAGNAKVIFPEAAKLGWLEKDLIKTKGKKYRDIAKNAGFAVCYGASAETVFAYLRAKGFNVSLSDVTAMLDQMRSTYRRYYDFVDENFAFVKRHGFMRTAILGRIRWFGWHETLPKTMNYPIQSGIADLMNERLINMIPQLPKGARLIAQIHDACIFECKKSVVAGMQELIQTTWDAPVIIPVSAVCRDGAQLQMPIDIKTGERWSDL